MDRRRALKLLGSAAALGGVPRRFETITVAQESVPFTVYGKDTGPTLLLGPPLALVRWPGLGDPVSDIRREYLSRLVDRYRVIVLDYPPPREDPLPFVNELTADRWCQDMLTVADAAQTDRFA